MCSLLSSSLISVIVLMRAESRLIRKEDACDLKSQASALGLDTNGRNFGWVNAGTLHIAALYI